MECFQGECNDANTCLAWLLLWFYPCRLKYLASIKKSCEILWISRKCWWCYNIRSVLITAVRSCTRMRNSYAELMKVTESSRSYKIVRWFSSWLLSPPLMRTYFQGFLQRSSIVLLNFFKTVRNESEFYGYSLNKQEAVHDTQFFITLHFVADVCDHGRL